MKLNPEFSITDFANLTSYLYSRETFHGRILARNPSLLDESGYPSSMDSRRLPRTVVDPKVRRVGFFTTGEPPPARSQSFPADTGASTTAGGGIIFPPTKSDLSIGGISLSHVMIPPPRLASADGLPALSRAAATAAPVSVHSPLSPLRRDAIQMPIGCFNPSEYMQGTSAMLSPSSSRFDGLEFSEEVASAAWHGRKGSGKEVASFPERSGEMMMMMTVKSGGNAPTKSVLTTASVVKTLPGVTAKDAGTFIESQNEGAGTARSQKQMTTKAERRAIQEAQRIAKRAAKEAGKGGKPAAASSSGAPANAKQDKGARSPSQKKDGPQDIATAFEKRADRNHDKDRKKDVPQPSLQFDDKNRVEKAKKRAVVNQFEARNKVELFRHLPQYEHGSQLPYLESKFFHLDHIHPSVYKEQSRMDHPTQG